MAGAIGGGLGGSSGILSETIYASYTTAGTFFETAGLRTLEPRSAKIQERIHITQGTGLAYGRSIDLGSRRVNTWTDAGGYYETEFLSTGMALLLANALGSSAVLTAAGTGVLTNAYTTMFSYGVPDDQNYFAFQNLVPDTGGSIHAESYHGGKITKAEWKIERGGLLMCTYTMDFAVYETASSAFTPSEVTSSFAFDAAGMNFKAGTYGSEAAVDGVRTFTLTIERELDVERIYLGDANKSEPVTKGVTKLTCAMDVDLLSSNKSVLWDIYNSQVATSIIADFIGPEIGSTGANNEIKFNITEAFVDTNGTPELDGPDIVKASLTFTGLISPANTSPLTATLTTGDSGF